jgi:hypothetical protein
MAGEASPRSLGSADDLPIYPPTNGALAEGAR